MKHLSLNLLKIIALALMTTSQVSLASLPTIKLTPSDQAPEFYISPHNAVCVFKIIVSGEFNEEEAAKNCNYTSALWKSETMDTTVPFTLGSFDRAMLKGQIKTNRENYIQKSPFSITLPFSANELLTRKTGLYIKVTCGSISKTSSEADPFELRFSVRQNGVTAPGSLLELKDTDFPGAIPTDGTHTKSFSFLFE